MMDASQLFGDLRPDQSCMWTDARLRALRDTEEKFGDADRAARIACIERELQRRAGAVAAENAER